MRSSIIPEENNEINNVLIESEESFIYLFPLNLLR